MSKPSLIQYTIDYSSVDRNMKKGLIVTSGITFLPIVILSILALTQHGEYSYNKLGGIIVIIVLPAYIGLLLLAMVILSILKKKDIALGLLVSFGIGFFVSIILLGMGL
jgi:hypothetical protein